MAEQSSPELLQVVTLSWLQLPVFSIVCVTIFCGPMWYGKEWEALSCFSDTQIMTHLKYSYIYTSFLACSYMQMNLKLQSCIMCTS